jgi:hypothetical protein
MENSGGYLQRPQLRPESNIYNDQSQEKPLYNLVTQGVTAVSDPGNAGFHNSLYPSFHQNLNPNFALPGPFASNSPANVPVWTPQSVEPALLGIQPNLGNDSFHTSVNVDPFVRQCLLRQIILANFYEEWAYNGSIYARLWT